MIMDIISLIGILLMLIIIPLGIIIVYRNKMKSINIYVNELAESVNDSLTEKSTLSAHERLNYTKDLLLFIDDLVTTELINKKRKELFLNSSKKDIDFDRVIEEISTTVFDGIKNDVLESPDNIIETQYIMNYIIKRTTLAYLKYLEDKVSHTL